MLACKGTTAIQCTVAGEMQQPVLSRHNCRRGKMISEPIARSLFSVLPPFLHSVLFWPVRRIPSMLPLLSPSPPPPPSFEPSRKQLGPEWRIYVAFPYRSFFPFPGRFFQTSRAFSASSCSLAASRLVSLSHTHEREARGSGVKPTCSSGMYM